MHSYRQKGRNTLYISVFYSRRAQQPQQQAAVEAFQLGFFVRAAEIIINCLECLAQSDGAAPQAGQAY